MSGRFAAAIVAAFLVVGVGTAAVAQPEPDPAKQCKKGRTVGGGTTQDYNQNGYVCVDPETGEVYDDKDQFAPEGEPSGSDVDENNDGIVCYNPTIGVVTDNRMPPSPFEEPDPTYEPCPPGYAAYPAALFP